MPGASDLGACQPDWAFVGWCRSPGCVSLYPSGCVLFWVASSSSPCARFASLAHVLMFSRSPVAKRQQANANKQTPAPCIKCGGIVHMTKKLSWGGLYYSSAVCMKPKVSWARAQNKREARGPEPKKMMALMVSSYIFFDPWYFWSLSKAWEGVPVGALFSQKIFFFF